ncbi:MAG TPA: outer membrane lipoprotein carrier protein LolA [Bacteroidales bacterium]|jgi:outer membrane lipoprotein-sorting protein|nr:outer membrane lipoprotein carrier protein LolA [Bacteroidales bacterium]|tara:strand:+ start:726 stop:1361 length:636 start_codon:yes stop_codon:yes gene_type:complete
MKNILLIISLLISGVIVAQSDKEAEKLLEDVINHTSSYKNFKANLSYTMVNVDMGIDEKKSGVIYVQGDSYRIEMEGQIIISDGTTIWTYLEDSEEVMVSNVEDNEESISPTQILTKYNESYKAKFGQSNKYKNSKLKEICLRPKDRKNFEQISVIVNANKLSLENFSVYDVNGNVFTYHIIDLQSDLDLPKGTFIFDYASYPDVEVIDMR